MCKRTILTYEEKISLIPSICLLLEISYDLMIKSVNRSMMVKVNGIDDEFLKYGYSLIMSGLDPHIIKAVLNNLIDNEPDNYMHLKMRMQRDVILAMQQHDHFNISVLITFSYLGLGFKYKFLDEIKKHNFDVYCYVLNYSLFTKYNLDTCIENMEKIESYEYKRPPDF